MTPTTASQVASIDALTVAVDIGGTKIAVGLIDTAGRIVERADTPTAPREGFDAAIQRVSGLVGSLRRGNARAVGGIGIGCTGPVDPVSGEIGRADLLPGWQGRNPVAELADRFGLPVAMENDADAAALAELTWGAGRGWRNLVCVTIGTGIGGGIILGGALYRGVGGAHPEVGHHVIDASGPKCYCGAHGCWEVLASGPAIAAQAAAAMGEGITAAQVCELARQGDAKARGVVERAGRYLGIGVANLITLYAPDAILLSGSVMDSADLLMPAIREVVRETCTQVPADQVVIAPATLGRDAPLIGAAAAWRHRYYQAPRAC